MNRLRVEEESKGISKRILVDNISVKDGIVYDACQLLRDVREMVREEKGEYVEK